MLMSLCKPKATAIVWTCMYEYSTAERNACNRRSMSAGELAAKQIQAQTGSQESLVLLVWHLT